MHVIFSDNFLLPNYYYYYKSSSDFKIIETNCKKPVNGQMSYLIFRIKFRPTYISFSKNS